MNSPSNLEGETIEMKMNRVLNNKEPITDGAPIIYMERKDGVKEEYDVRTDRFDFALDAVDKINKSKLAKRDAKIKEQPAQPSQAAPEQTHGTEPAA